MNNIPAQTKYGLLAGTIIIILKYLLAITYPGINIKAWLMEYTGSLLMLGVILFVALTAQRKENGGVTTFKAAFFSGVYISFIAALIVGCFQYVYTRYMDPGSAERLVQYTIQQLKNSGAKEEKIQDAVNRARVYYTPGSQFQAGLTWMLYSGVLVSALIALAIKKDTRYNNLENNI